MNPHPTTARDLALAALGDRAGNVTAHLNRLLVESGTGGADAALARELALGVVRRRATLDAVIDTFQVRPRRLGGRIRNVLRMGLYQILFLDRVPDFAAVSEAVNQARPTGAGSAGFVNALLRAAGRSVSPPQAGPPPLAADALPLGPSSFRCFDRAIFPDPAESEVAYLAAALSLPEALAEKWLARFDGLGGALPIALHANARPPLILRVNALRATVDEVLAELRSAGVEAAAHANGASVVVTSRVSLAALAVFTDGKVQPQDAAATAVVAQAGGGIQPGMRVLDLCAAPGTKTTHLAERMQNRGQILAVDVSEAKLQRIRDNCGRMGITIVQTLLAEQVGQLQEGSFDLVLVDAPCSNTGVLARRPEARWRLSPKALAALAKDQRPLLGLGLRFVRGGGACIYSTCSLEDQENEAVVRSVVSRGDCRLDRQRRVLPAGAEDPTRWSDGGYFAVLGR